MTPRFVTAQFIADDLDVDLSTAYRYMNEMFALRTGGIVRVTRQRYEAWLRKRSGWAVEGSRSDASTRAESSGGEFSRVKTENRSESRSGSRSRPPSKMTRSRYGSLEPENIVMPKPRRQRHA